MTEEDQDAPPVDLNYERMRKALANGRGYMAYYRLHSDGKTPIPVADVIEWAKWFDTPEKRIVQQDFLGITMVSTVFLGMDHSWTVGGPPVLWETMIFKGELDGWQRRATSYELALAYHADALAEVRHSRLPHRRAWYWLRRFTARLFKRG